jgi:hypothetical protein
MILGILGLKKSPTSRRLAIGGIALNGVGLLLTIIITIAFLFISTQAKN